MEALAVLSDRNPIASVFVATDDPNLIKEAEKDYPQYSFHRLKGASEMAAAGFTNIYGE